MRYLLSIAICAVITGSSLNTSAQQKANIRNKVKITESQVQKKVKGDKTVLYIDPASLKKGNNYIKLPSGNILYAEYTGTAIKSFSLTTAAGILKGRLVRGNMSTQFQCGNGFCICYGDGDCNDMFTTNVCGPSAICFGEICVCTR